MKAKLIKTESGYNLFTQGFLKASTEIDLINQLNIEEGNIRYHLSKQNCDEIFGVVDVNSEVEAVVKTICPDDRGKDVIYGTGMAVGIQCFNKAIELNKYKVFTVEDVIDVIYKQVRNGFDGVIDSFTEAFAKECINRAMKLYQPTEIEVEVEMECLDPNCDGINKKGVCIPSDKPKLDENNCLILKKI